MNKSEEDENREFIITLMRDSLSWTPHKEITPEGIKVIKQGLTLLLKEKISNDDFMSLRKSLTAANMGVSPVVMYLEKQKEKTQ